MKNKKILDFFNVSLELGQPISDIAAAQGVGYFQGNAKLIVSTAGCFLVNTIWFIVLGTKDKTLKEFTSSSGISFNLRFKNFIWSALAGAGVYLLQESLINL